MVLVNFIRDRLVTSSFANAMCSAFAVALVYYLIDRVSPTKKKHPGI